MKLLKCVNFFPGQIGYLKSIKLLVPGCVNFLQMDGAGNGGKIRKMVFVTVGTTCFDALVKAADSRQVKEALSKRGYTDLMIQMGRGSYVPSKVPISLNCSFA